ncbi:MAG: Fe2+-dependent dioxygenase [Gammaproteobacteria bacterium]
MLTIIPEVLDAAQLQTVQSLVEMGNFKDGRLSAGHLAQRVKNNEEMSNPNVIEKLNSIVMARLVQHTLFQAVAHPVRVASAFYARYTSEMSYGDHVDDPVMGPPGGQYRSDLSATVFLNAPDEYEGGELTINTSFKPHKIKLNAGDAVIYPSSSLHRVTPISRGTRLVAVTWIQSMIREPDRRELLYQLYQTREKLLAKNPACENAAQLDHAYINLVRMWAEV